MSIRAIWIVGTLPENYGKILFYRKFVVIEKQAQMILGEYYLSSPTDSEFSAALLLSLGLPPESQQFVAWRDCVNKDIQLPVVTIKIKGKELWPIVILEKHSCIICCLPLVENDQNNLSVSSISVGFSLLTGILHFLGPDTVYVDELCERFQELNNYLSINMPLGTPTETDSKRIVASYNEPLLFAAKPGAVNSLPYKGKPSILIEVCEYVRSSQSDSHIFQPVVEVYGAIDVKLDTPNHINELSVSLDHSIVGSSLSLKSIGIHPCVQTVTCIGGSSVPKKLWVIPTLQCFTLCSYSVSFSSLPITGIYKMKECTSVEKELLVQLKLSEDIKNNFNLCEVYIPFTNCGLISNFEFKANQGFLNISKDKQALKWNIGSKFPVKTLEVFLTAKIQFSDVSNQHTNTDTFCIGKNAYVQVNFRKSYENFSGCTIDPKTVIVSPPQKSKVFINCSVQSSEFVIWNSFGDIPFPVIPKHLCLKE